MRAEYKGALLGSLASLSLLAAVFWAGPGMEELSTGDLLSLEAQADVRVLGARLLKVKSGGGTLWSVRAEEARLYAPEGIIDADQVSGRAAGPKGAVKFTASHATVDREKGRIRLYGGVVLKTDGGRTLRTGSLAFVEGEARLYTQDWVKLEDRGILVQGKGMTYDLKSGKLKLERQKTVIRER